jgi:TyrR family helix-turn-helix protein
LYYRLNVFPIRVPSLTERKTEIPALIQHFMTKYSEKFGMKRNINEEAVDYLKECRWPGNIRELENVVQRLMITSKGETINAYDAMKELNSDLFGKLQKEEPESMIDASPLELEKMVENYEREIIRFAYEKYGSSRRAAKALNISQTQILRKKSKYSIE